MFVLALKADSEPYPDNVTNPALWPTLSGVAAAVNNIDGHELAFTKDRTGRAECQHV